MNLILCLPQSQIVTFGRSFFGGSTVVVGSQSVVVTVSSLVVDREPHLIISESCAIGITYSQHVKKQLWVARVQTFASMDMPCRAAQSGTTLVHSPELAPSSKQQLVARTPCLLINRSASQTCRGFTTSSRSLSFPPART